MWETHVQSLGQEDLLEKEMATHSSIPWRRQWQPIPVFLPGKSHGQRNLVDCSAWGRGELDTTERLHFCFSLSCVGEGNGNPLQCSCLENPRDGGAWWAAVYGVTQSWTQLKWLSSSSSQYSCWRISWTASLAGYSPWGCKGSDKTEWLTLSFTFTLITPEERLVPSLVLNAAWLLGFKLLTISH